MLIHHFTLIVEGAGLSAVADVDKVGDVRVVRLAGAGLVSIADTAARTERPREVQPLDRPFPNG